MFPNVDARRGCCFKAWIGGRWQTGSLVRKARVPTIRWARRHGLTVYRGMDWYTFSGRTIAIMPLSRRCHLLSLYAIWDSFPYVVFSSAQFKQEALPVIFFIALNSRFSFCFWSTTGAFYFIFINFHYFPSSYQFIILYHRGTDSSLIYLMASANLLQCLYQGA